jgi:hypothetical protein
VAGRYGVRGARPTSAFGKRVGWGQTAVRGVETSCVWEVLGPGRPGGFLGSLGQGGGPC